MFLCCLFKILHATCLVFTEYHFGNAALMIPEAAIKQLNGFDLATRQQDSLDVLGKQIGGILHHPEDLHYYAGLFFTCSLFLVVGSSFFLWWGGGGTSVQIQTLKFVMRNTFIAYHYVCLAMYICMKSVTLMTYFHGTSCECHATTCSYF